MPTIRELYELIKENGSIVNFSSKPLWVIENSSGTPTAHILSPGFKTPPDIDADGLKRVDGKPISKHKHWWKIYDFTEAEVYDDGVGLSIDVSIMQKVPDKKFGEYTYDRTTSWGIPIKTITGVERKQGRVIKYQIEGHGWLTRKQAVQLAYRGEIHNVTVVHPHNTQPYLRTKPDKSSSNNISSMG